MTPLTDDENWYYEEQKQCYICRNHFDIIKNKKKRFKLYKKVRGIILSFTGKFRGAAHSICNLHQVPREIPVKIHNGSKYDYHFIIKELAEKFRGEEFECLGENILAIQFQLKKNMIMIVVKQSYTK